MRENIEAFVSKADDRFIRVNLLNNSYLDKLTKYGFNYDSELGEYIFETESDEQKALMFTKLRDDGICFSSGREWCPAEVFDYFREIKLLSGHFRKISWVGPGKYRISEE